MGSETGEQRNYERYPGQGFRVQLRIGDVTRSAEVVDIAIGGAALRTANDGLHPGAEVAVTARDLVLPGRVARLQPDGVVVAFRQNAETLAAAQRLVAAVTAPAAA